MQKNKKNLQCRPEISIKPWELLLDELKEGNERMKWMDRQPYAYWKGNPVVATTRQELLMCNVSETQDWNARVYAQDWLAEARQGFKSSDLANQCDYRQCFFLLMHIILSNTTSYNVMNLQTQLLISAFAKCHACRYKIYIEGSAWSVSEKYILACDSLSLIVTPKYYDFFTRELMPVHHYWPIQDGDKCRSIKFAVDWGNSHKQKVIPEKN